MFTLSTGVMALAENAKDDKLGKAVVVSGLPICTVGTPITGALVGILRILLKKTLY